MPLPLGTRRTAVVLGGVPAERDVARGADGPQQVLYLHGGGYKTGSPTSHRSRIVNNRPGLMREYRRRTAQFDVTEYETL